MGHTPSPPNRLQIDPHHRYEVFRQFCPSIEFNGHQTHRDGNGLVYPQEGDEPIQEFPDRPFFWINSMGRRVPGNLWDWIVKDSHGNFYVVHGHKGD